MKRTAYLLSTHVNPRRVQHSTEILQKVGFTVNNITAFDFRACQNNKYLSHLLSFKYILQTALTKNEKWFYFFEDDINLIEPIDIEEIVCYERLSSLFFYLGCCVVSNDTVPTKFEINEHTVYQLNGDIRGSHALGISLLGAEYILKLIEDNQQCYITDVLLSRVNNNIFIPCVRFELTSRQNNCHKGIFFQDRNEFGSEMDF